MGATDLASYLFYHVILIVLELDFAVIHFQWQVMTNLFNRTESVMRFQKEKNKMKFLSPSPLKLMTCEIKTESIDAGT